jgi:hypothetical protein
MDIVEGSRVPEMYGLKNQAPDQELKWVTIGQV